MEQKRPFDDDEAFDDLRTLLRSPDRPGWTDRIDRRRVLTMSGCALLLAAVVFGIGALRPPAGAASAPPAGDLGPAATPLPGPSAEPPAPPTVQDGDGARYAVGRPGDLVVVGDWACRGAATPAVLRPGSGELSVFDGWPEPGADATARHVSATPGATGLDAADDCGAAVVHLADGSSRLVPTGPQP